MTADASLAAFNHNRTVYVAPLKDGGLWFSEVVISALPRQRYATTTRYDVTKNYSVVVEGKLQLAPPVYLARGVEFSEAQNIAAKDESDTTKLTILKPVEPGSMVEQVLRDALFAKTEKVDAAEPPPRAATTTRRPLLVIAR